MISFDAKIMVYLLVHEIKYLNNYTPSFGRKTPVVEAVGFWGVRRDKNAFAPLVC